MKPQPDTMTCQHLWMRRRRGGNSAGCCTFHGAVPKSSEDGTRRGNWVGLAGKAAFVTLRSLIDDAVELLDEAVVLPDASVVKG